MLVLLWLLSSPRILSALWHDISTLNKGKAPASTNNIEAYNKEALDDEIHKLIVTNV